MAWAGEWIFPSGPKENVKQDDVRKETKCGLELSQICHNTCPMIIC